MSGEYEVWNFNPLKAALNWHHYHKENERAGQQNMEFIRLLHIENSLWVEYKFNTSDKTYHEPIDVVADLLRSYQVTQEEYCKFQYYLSLNNLYCSLFRFMPAMLKQKYVDYALRKSGE